jgi:Zn-dependent protease with chaperone function
MIGTAPARPDYSILSAFDQPISRPRIQVLYQISLLLVALIMVLLPLVYLALVGGAVYAVYYHAVHHWGPIMDLGGVRGGRVMILKFMIYGIPLLIGVIVVFFMFKPILARRPKRAQPLALNPVDNPLLYAFIEKICETVGAPSPKRIDLDCELNASASFRRGFLSMMGKDLVLTLGLPLVANLNARELAGVVAHEFGHFTQNVGMRLSYLIRSVIVWFARVAYERDAWDVALDRWAMEEEDFRVTMILWTAQIGVWFSRLILKLLMFVGILFGGFLLRQMEYNADAYEIKVAGSETFERTQRKLATLGAALELTYQQLRFTWEKNHKLPDNLCELLRRSHEQLTPKLLQKIEDTLGLHRTSFFDTHPSPADRIRQARKAGEPGIVHDERPAASLFASFEHPARFVTLLHYTDNLGIPIKPDMLLHVESAQPTTVAAQAASTAASARDQYFLQILPLLLPLRLPSPVPSANYESDADELTRLSSSLQQVAEQLIPIASQYAEASRKRIQARAALRLLEARVPMRPEAFGLTETTVDAARTAEAESAATQDALRHSVHEVAAALNRRLQLGLSLRLADRGEYGTEPVSAERVQELVSSLNLAADHYAHQDEAMDSLAVLDQLVAQMVAGGETPVLSRALAAQTEIVNSFIANPSGRLHETNPKPGLQLAKRQRHASAGDVEGLRTKTLQWFADYHAGIEELVQLAQTAEIAGP